VGLCELRRLHQQTPHNTNTHNHFVTTLVGLMKFKQVGGKIKITSPKQSPSTYTTNPRERNQKIEEEAEREDGL